MRKPFFISTLLTLLVLSIFTLVYFTFFIEMNKWIPIGFASVWSTAYLIFNFLLWRKKRRWRSEQHLETEDETLTLLLHPLLDRMGKKPLYLLIGTKNAGKTHFLFSSNALSPVCKYNTVKNDFFEWYESDKAVYIKPKHRLIFQETSTVDSLLWQRFVTEIICFRPRKPFNGCLFFVDFEFIIINTEEHLELDVSTLCKRLEYITDQTSSALPIYLMMSKLDKLDGFKEYIQFSPIRSTVEFLSIQLKDAKGAMINYFNDSYIDLVNFMEMSTLDVSSHSNGDEEKRSILTFPKQFELCHTEVRSVIESINSINHGKYKFDIREVFFFSSHQGGKKYNLLAKSCSDYFNIPIIASKSYHLSETPYFTRFLVDVKIISESEFAGENKKYLRRIQRKSIIAISVSGIVIASGGLLIFNTLKSNLLVMDTLIQAKEKPGNIYDEACKFTERLLNVNIKIKPSFDAWFIGNEELEKEISSLNMSYLDESTKLAYNILLSNIHNDLIPLIEEAYRKELIKNKHDLKDSLFLLKGYLMLNDESKRDLPFLTQQIKKVFDQIKIKPDLINQTMILVDAYFRTPFSPVVINMDLVRATRRDLLSKSNVDFVYQSLLELTKETDLGRLNLARAVGFDFSNVFIDKIDSDQLNINKIYTETGFSTFFRPNVDLMSKEVISDNWVLGLTNNIQPTKTEQDAFKEEVRKRYTDDYVSDWRNALSELKIKKYKNIADLSNGIDLISAPSSPITKILNLLYSNTSFSPLDLTLPAVVIKGKNTKKEKLIDIVEGVAEELVKPDYLLMTRVEQAFRSLNRLLINETPTSPAPWDEIIAALSQVRTYIKDIADSPNPQMAALSAAKLRMNTSEADPIIRLKQIAQKSPEPVRTWLLDIVSQTWSIIIHEGFRGIQTKWYTEVYTPFKAIGLNQYPFNKNAKKEISLESFELLFSSGGILDNFIKENFSPFYDTVLWKAKRLDGEIMPLSSSVLIQLKNYNVIRDTLINESTNKFNVPFNLKILDLDSSAIRANIKIADSNIAYYQGPTQAREIKWPPESGETNVSITIQDVTDEGKQHILTENGQWAIFRLFWNSLLFQSNDGTLISEINVSGREIKVKITPLTTKNPFTLKELTNFTLPKNI